MLDGLRPLIARGEVEKLPGRLGYRLKSDGSARLAVERAIRRLTTFLRTLEIPAERRGRWTDKGWLYARHSMTAAVLAVEPELEAQLGRPCEEPSAVRRADLNPMNPRAFVTIPGWSMTVSSGAQDIGESVFAQGVENASRECCRLCGGLLPHTPEQMLAHERVRELLRRVRGFRPEGHSHDPCSDACRAFWNLDYVRGMIDAYSREPPRWVSEVPPAPRVIASQPGARPVETQTPTPAREVSRHRRPGPRAGRVGKRSRRGTSRRSP